MAVRACIGSNGNGMGPGPRHEGLSFGSFWAWDNRRVHAWIGSFFLLLMFLLRLERRRGGYTRILRRVYIRY